MATIIRFNGVKYALSALRARAGSTPHITIKREDAVLDPSIDILAISQTELDKVIDRAEQKLQSASAASQSLIAVSYGGKYYFVQGLEKAIARFQTTDTVEARFVSKFAMKTCVLGYEGGKIVPETPEPVRRFSNTREQQGDWSRPKYNRDR